MSYDSDECLGSYRRPSGGIEGQKSKGSQWWREIFYDYLPSPRAVEKYGLPYQMSWFAL